MKEIAVKLGQPLWAIGLLIVVAAIVTVFGSGDGHWLLITGIAIVFLTGLMWGFRQSVINAGRKEAGQLTRTAEAKGLPYPVEYDIKSGHFFLVSARKEYDMGKGKNVQNKLYEYIRYYTIHKQLP